MAESFRRSDGNRPSAVYSKKFIICGQISLYDFYKSLIESEGEGNKKCLAAVNACLSKLDDPRVRLKDLLKSCQNIFKILDQFLELGVSTENYKIAERFAYKSYKDTVTLMCERKMHKSEKKLKALVPKIKVEPAPLYPRMRRNSDSEYATEVEIDNALEHLPPDDVFMVKCKSEFDDFTFEEILDTVPDVNVDIKVEHVKMEQFDVECKTVEDYLNTETGLDGGHLTHYMDKRDQQMKWEMKRMTSVIENLAPPQNSVLEHLLNKTGLASDLFGNSKDNADSFQTQQVVISDGELVARSQGCDNVITSLLRNRPSTFTVGPFRIYHNNQLFAYLCLLGCNSFMTSSIDLMRHHLRKEHPDAKADWGCSDCDLVVVAKPYEKNDLEGALHHLAEKHSTKTTAALALGNFITWYSLNYCMQAERRRSKLSSIVKETGVENNCV